MSPAQPSYLRFAWWNLHNFAHFDPTRVGVDRWPETREEYDEKCRRVDTALRELIARHPPDILGLCEITVTAAEELRQRLFPHYRLLDPGSPPAAPFQVAVLYRDRAGFKPVLPVVPERVPGTTRAFQVVNFVRGDSVVKFIHGYWTAFGDNSSVYRERLADTLTEVVYEFLSDARAKSRRHVVVLGDLNEEPFAAVVRDRLGADRHHAAARRRAHRTDEDVRRVRLYNTAWRLLGERHAHDGTSQPGFAGTYYHAADQRWHTYDQVIVSGGLLGSSPPVLDEAAVEIMPLAGCLEPNGIPESFRWNGGQATGLSDHLPVVGRLVLS